MSRSTASSSVISLMPGTLGLALGAGESAGGSAWLVLHGGPGSGVSPSLLRPFDAMPQARVLAPVQLGCDPLPWRASEPVTLSRQLRALEALRQHEGGGAWRVLAGSWGAYLAMMYARAHPQALDALVLRGAFMGGAADIWRLLKHIAALVRSGAAQGFAARLPKSRTRLAPALARLCQLSQSGAVATTAAPWVQAWLLAETQMALRGARRARLEGSVFSLGSVGRDLSRSARRRSASLRMGQGPTSRERRKVMLQWRMLPAALAQPALRGFDRRVLQKTSWKLVQGRFDRVCSGAAVASLARRLEPIGLEWVNSGHLGTEEAMLAALARAVKEAG